VFNGQQKLKLNSYRN